MRGMMLTKLMEPEPLISRHGGYRKLLSFPVAQLCYDVTVRFCDRYISIKKPDPRSDGAGGARRGAEYR